LNDRQQKLRHEAAFEAAFLLQERRALYFDLRTLTSRQA